MSKWAIVTGASKGIGRSLAYKLAEKNYNLIVIARSLNSLMELKQDIEARYQIICLVIVQNLGEDAASVNIWSQIPPEVFLNKPLIFLNAAISTLGEFGQTPLPQLQNLLRVNISFNAVFAKMLCDQLIQCSGGEIYFFSSQGALLPTPYMAAYSASKSFIHSLALALSYEYQHTNVKIYTVIPAATKTSNMDAIGVPADVQKALVNAKLPEDIALEIMRTIEHGKHAPAELITNVKGFYFFRLVMGIFPIRFLMRKASEMLRSFRSKAFFENQDLCP